MDEPLTFEMLKKMNDDMYKAWRPPPYVPLPREYIEYLANEKTTVVHMPSYRCGKTLMYQHKMHKRAKFVKLRRRLYKQVCKRWF